MTNVSHFEFHGDSQSSIVALPFCHFEIRASKRGSSEYPEALETVGDHVRKRRLDLGLAQNEAAKIMGVNEATIVNCENNHTQPRINHTAGVVRFLGYSPFVDRDMTGRLVNGRRTACLTQRALARLLRVDPSTLAQWERGERQPTASS
jgi:DNA-binding XRE family transcriptional regulator